MTKRRFLPRVGLALLGVWLVVLLGGGIVHAQNYSVAILVVDDFTSPDLSDINANQYGPGDNCAVSLEGQAFAVRGVSATPINQPHGELVYAELEQMLNDYGAGNIWLSQVDIHGATTDQAANLIENALSSEGADAYVVNMSFAIIPCEYFQSLQNSEGQLKNARNNRDNGRQRSLFEQAVLFYDGTVFPVMSQKAQRANDLDPLQVVFSNWGSNVFPVASAGNFGLNFPFWPGAWGQVVSVSASESSGFYPGSSWDKKKDTPLLVADPDAQGKKKRISNYGEVMVPGQYNSDYGQVFGTSFAAPRMSFAAALYLSQVGPNFCRNNQGGPGLAYGDWKNLTLPEAAQKYCPDMLAYLPQ